VSRRNADVPDDNPRRAACIARAARNGPDGASRGDVGASERAQKLGGPEDREDCRISFERFNVRGERREIRFASSLASRASAVMSTSLTSTRSARTAQSAWGSRSDTRIGVPLPEDVALPSWCRGSRENLPPPSAHPTVNAQKAPAKVYHPRASRPARAFGEPEPLDPTPPRARARSARVAAPVAAGFKAGAKPGDRPTTVDPTGKRGASSTAIPAATATPRGGPPRSPALDHERGRQACFCETQRLGRGG
jgi:hypothetical protein